MLILSPNHMTWPGQPMICIWLSLVPDVLQLANRAPGTKILIKVLPSAQPSDGDAETKREREKKKWTKKKSLFFSKYHLGNKSHSSKTLQTSACIWNLIVTSGCLFYYGGKYCYNAKHQVLNWNLTALLCNDFLFPFLLIFFKVKKSIVSYFLQWRKKA